MGDDAIPGGVDVGQAGPHHRVHRDRAPGAERGTRVGGQGGLGPYPDDDQHHIGRPGHGRALRSLSRNWQSWISARDRYPAIQIPVTLAYGDHDWSNEDERDANRQAIPAVRATTIQDCGHFSSLENPVRVTALIRDVLALPGRNAPKADT